MSDLHHAAEIPDVEAEMLTDPFGGDPQPIEPGLLPVPSFRLALLPEVFESFVRDIAERLQCPPDFPAVTVIVCAASVIGRQIGLRPKVYDDWTVVPNLWAEVVGPPGVMKSPAMKEAKKPLGYLVAIANKDFKAKRIAGAFEEIRLAGQRKHVTDAIKKAQTSADLDALRSQFEALEAEALVVTRRRYETNDATIEKLGMMMNENPNGILLFCDELSYWFQGFEREGHQQDRAFWEKAWMGTADGSVDRVGRGELYIEACCGSILGGIQPGPLAHWLRDTFGSGRTDDGLAQRFQLAVFPDIGPWEDVQRRPDTEARRRVYEVFEKLATLDHEAIGAHKPEMYEDALPYCRFTPEAQERWDAWYGDLERGLHRPSDEHPVIVNHLAKYPSLLASLALVDHVVDCVASSRGGPISEACFERALGWVRYLEPHARRIYACVSDAARSTTAALAVKLREGKLTSPFTSRDVTQRDWSGLTDRDAVSKALTRLEGLHWLRKEDRRGPGRPTTVYHLNPKVTATWP